MATMTVSLPDALKVWIEQQVATGDYASTSDYIRDAVRRDRDRRAAVEPMTSEELDVMLERSRQSGISTRTTKEIFDAAAAQVAAKTRRHG